VSFRWPLRVYWEDTDAAGIVFYANYLKYFERARTEWLRSKGFEQERLRVERSLGFVVVQTELRYRAPARLDDALVVTVEPTRLGAASLQVAQQAWRGETLVCEGTIRVGSVDLSTHRPVPMPSDILQSLR
jgi:acyl-CoA thioester hydrolase